MGELLEIWLKKLHGEPMISLTEADVIAGEGIAGSAKEPGTKRQVTVQRRVGNQLLKASVNLSTLKREGQIL